MRPILLVLASLTLACTDPKDSATGDDGTDGSDGTALDGGSDGAADGTDGAADGTDGTSTSYNGEPPDSPIAAPEFTATNRDGGARDREDLLGHPTVMWFYPAAGTYG